MFNEIEGRSSTASAKPRKEVFGEVHQSPMWQPQEKSGGSNWKTAAVFGISALALGLSTIALAVSASGDASSAKMDTRVENRHANPAPYHQRYEPKHQQMQQHFNPQHPHAQNIQTRTDFMQGLRKHAASAQQRQQHGHEQQINTVADQSAPVEQKSVFVVRH